MKVLKIFSGLISLVLTFVGLSLLVGPFIPSAKNLEMTLVQHLVCACLGALAIGVAVFLWIWSAKNPRASK